LLESVSSKLSDELDEHASISPQASTQTSKDLSAHSPRKDKLRQKIRSLQARNLYAEKKRINSVSSTEEANVVSTATLEDFKSLCDIYLPTSCANFVKLQADLHKKTPKQRRYSKEFLQVCLKIYFMGPKAYRNLSNLFIFPTKRTQQNDTKLNFMLV
jgi:hypothetical protein